MSSTLVLSFTLLLAAVFGQESPIEQVIREEIYEMNKKMVEEHLDIQPIKGFSYSSFALNLQVAGGEVGNFSTTTLIGSPALKQVDKETGTSYYLQVVLGLELIELQLDYSATLLYLFSSSGTMSLRNTGNALKAEVVINTYTGKTPCDAALKRAVLQDLGSTELSFEPRSSHGWFLSKFFKLFYFITKRLLQSAINQNISNFVHTSTFKTEFSEMACKPFN